MLVFVGSAGKGCPYLKVPGEAAGRGVVNCFLLDADGHLKASGSDGLTVGESPTAIVPHGDEKGLIITSETFADVNSTVWSVAIDDHSTGALRILNHVDSGGRASCHLALHPAGTHVAWSNYLGEPSDPADRGTWAICEVGSGGLLQKRTTHFAHEGASGANEARQEAPHAHCSLFVPMEAAGKWAVFVCDLGADKIFQYVVGADGVAIPNPTAASVQASEAGSGPRHAAAHPAKPYVYVINELLSTVQVHTFDATNGALSEKPIQVLSTIPPGHEKVGDATYSNAAALKAHPSGKFLYGSNRGHDSIVIYKVGDDGKLSYVACEMTGGTKTCGMGPRDFDISPCGNFVVLGNQDDDTVVSYRIDLETGLLTKLSEIACAAPVSVRIMPPSRKRKSPEE